MNGKQHTVRLYVDGMMSIQVKKMNDRFYEWLNKMYGGHGKVKSMFEQVHDYLNLSIAEDFEISINN